MAPIFFIGRKLNSQTRNWLEKNAIDFEEHPLIQIELVQHESEKSDVEFLRRQFVVTSQWSAKWLSENFSKVKFSDNDSVFCISEKQKKILRTFTNQIFVSEKQNAASLAQLIIQRNTIETVVFLHGNKALDVIPSELKLKGVKFERLEVYRNFPQKIRVDIVYDAYLFFSPSGVESFVKGGNVIPPASKIVTIGNTTAEKSRQFFKNDHLVSAEQEEFAFVKYAVESLKHPELQV